MIEDAQIERRISHNERIDHLLNERHQLLNLLLDVSKSIPVSENDFKSDALEEFMEILVDYVAAGHFSLYQRIAEGNERRMALASLAATLYPQIEKTTEFALAFEEKFNAENDSPDVEHFQAELSKLGEILTTRIELEDQLIAIIEVKNSI